MLSTDDFKESLVSTSQSNSQGSGLWYSQLHEESEDMSPSLWYLQLHGEVEDVSPSSLCLWYMQSHEELEELGRWYSQSQSDAASLSSTSLLLLRAVDRLTPV